MLTKSVREGIDAGGGLRGCCGFSRYPLLAGASAEVVEVKVRKDRSALAVIRIGDSQHAICGRLRVILTCASRMIRENGKIML